ncbi:MAG: class I SAM-dependent methyltransferase [Stackebrandtia sp.]
MSKDGFDWAEEALDLTKAAQSDAEFYALIAGELTREGHRIAVDFGCGGGGMAVALRDSYRADGHDAQVVGLDAHPEVFEATQRDNPDIRFAKASFEDSPEQIREACGGAPDLIWARGAIHHADDEQEAIHVLAGALAPGGVLALNEGGTSVAHMPRHVGLGKPGLHFRLYAAMNASAEEKMADLNPMPYGWLTGMRKAGLENAFTRNVLYDKPAPLAGADMDHVLGKLEKQVGWAEEFLADEDLAAWKRLLDSDNDAWLGHRDDLFYLAANSVHIATKPR